MLAGLLYASFMIHTLRMLVEGCLRMEWFPAVTLVPSTLTTTDILSKVFRAVSYSFLNYLLTTLRFPSESFKQV